MRNSQKLLILVADIDAKKLVDKGMVEILKLKFVQDIETRSLVMFFMLFCSDFENKVCSRFLSLSSVEFLN